MKQFTAWRVRQLDGGVLEWTSPTGTTYTDTPTAYPATVRFAPSDDDTSDDDTGDDAPF